MVNIPIMHPSYRGKHSHAVRHSLQLFSDGSETWTSICPTGPNGVRQEQVFQGGVEEVYVHNAEKS
jgi:hypothetical protein